MRDSVLHSAFDSGDKELLRAVALDFSVAAYAISIPQSFSWSFHVSLVHL